MLSRLLNGVAAVAGAAAASQFPAFYAQYLQRLGGRADYAGLAQERIAEAARGAGLAVDAYLRHFADSDDTVVQRQGHLNLEVVADAGRLQEAYAALAGAGPFARPFALAGNLDPLLARDTLAAFEPAVPVTPEGIAYGALGALLGIAIAGMTERLARRLNPFRRRRRASPG